MTLDEFVDKLNALKARPSWEYIKEQTVRVKTNDPSVGPMSTTDVIAINCGSDWDRNSFTIWCEDKIYKNSKKNT